MIDVQRSVARPFPYHRRQHVLKDIADTFVRDGFDAGNKRAQAWGFTLIAKYAEAGIDGEEIVSELEKFIAAWKAKASQAIAERKRA